MGKKLGENIKKLRLSAGEVQQDIANSLSVTTKTISKWENGIFEPSIDMIERIASHYSVSIESVIYGSQVPNGLATPSPSKLAPKEAQLLEMFRQIDGYAQAQVLGFLQGLIENVKWIKEQQK